MKPLGASEIYGNWATPLLPINEDESIDFVRLGEEVDIIIASEVNGVYTNGTAGEFYAQTEAEFLRISALVAERCERAGVPFQIGASHTSPQTSLERVRRAREFKPGAIQVILPDWLPPNDDEVIAFLQRIAEASEPVGLVLYNPPHAKRVLKPPAYSKLKAAIPGLVGVKAMDGDAAWYQEMREHAADLSVFVPGHHLADGYRQGAVGSYSNVACLSPAGAQKWYELIKTDINRASEIEAKIRRFIKLHVAPFRTDFGYANAALDKLMAAIGNWCEIGSRLRWPYKWIPESEAKRLRPVAKEMLPELFE